MLLRDAVRKQNCGHFSATFAKSQALFYIAKLSPSSPCFADPDSFEQPVL
jgi:hypothetical protein